MKNGKSKSKLFDYGAIIFYALVFGLIILFITRNNYVYGSTIDWQNQHFLIPNYFRELFYQTKNLVPSLAMHLGGGQNIFYFSYYGLLSPIILISYIFPYIKMSTFISISSILLVYSSVVLFYFYLKKHQVSFITRFILGLLFLCAGPVIYHTHRQIMFVNYLPFLIGCLYGIDNIIEKDKPLLFIINFLMIILTSYYFSISSCFMLFIYYNYLIFSKDKLNFKTYLKKIVKIIIPIILAYLISAILILPTAYCLLNSRAGGGTKLSLLSLFKPHIRAYNALYSYNSMGLTAFALIGLFYTTFKNKSTKRLLGIILLSLIYFYLGCYILNGTLYTDPKALIPFIPLTLLFIKDFIDDIINHQINYKLFNIIALIVTILSFNKYLWLDGIALILMINIFKKQEKITLGVTSLIVISLAIGFSLSDPLVPKKEFEHDNNLINDKLFDNINNDDLYRVNNQIGAYSNFNYLANYKQYNATMYSSSTNKYYSKFYYDDTANNIPYRTRAMLVSATNPLFQIYMGEKYVLSEKDREYKANLIDSEGHIRLYERDYVLPIGYASTHTINRDEYKKLKYPARTLDLLGNIITDNETTNYNDIPYETATYEITSTKNLKYQNKKNHLIINSKNKGHLKLNVISNIKNPIVMIRFKNNTIPEKKEEEYHVSINGIKNRISAINWKYYNKNTMFDYVIYDTLDLDMSFMRGKYDFSNFNIYVIDYDDLKEHISDINPLIINPELTKGDILEGDITVNHDGYFKLSIPYDKGYKIYLNDELTNYELVDNNFIGLPIKKGDYHIVVKFVAPYLKVGEIVSLVGILSTITYIIILRNKKTIS